VFNPFHNNEEGTYLPNPIKTKKIAVLLIALFLTMYVSPFLPRVHAAVTALTVSPNEGKVLDRITVNGTVETSGSFNIFFDSLLVVNNVSDSEGKFTAYFNVPHAINGTHLITLQDALNHNDTKNFKVNTSFILVLGTPVSSQFQEGDSVTVFAQILGADPLRLYQQNITATTPANTVYYNATLPLLTNENGTASNTLNYPTNFIPVGKAHTNYTGTYRVRIYKNATTVGNEKSFVVGLTNATKYHRFDWVNIKAANYTKPNENATVTIKFGSKTPVSQKIQAENGTINYNWQIPANASMGTYRVTVTNASKLGTVKPVADAQNFTVPGLLVQILTKNLNEKPVGGVNATVYEIDPYNASKKTKVVSGFTNSSGWIISIFERGNYSFKAFWKNVQVNETTVFIQSNSSLILICQLANMEFTVIDGKTNLPMSFIFLNLTTRYVTVANVSASPSETYLTNNTGKWTLLNRLVKANYTIRASRTQLRFFNTSFSIPPGEKWFNISMACPVLSLTVHAEDARQTSLENYPVKIYEYTGGLYNQTTTDNSGNATFSCTFGIYKLRLYNKTETIVLNETYCSVINANTFFILRSSIYHANLTVRILDYFGQPVPNAKVKFECENTSPLTVATGADGKAFFSDITGGNGQVSVYIGDGVPSETAALYVEKSTTATIVLGKYVVIFGLIVEASQFAVCITLIAILVLFALFLFYRRRKTKLSSKESVEKKS